jgi:hypothetical protein
MPSSLSREVKAVQNPALGAMLLWRCCVGYSSTHPTADAIPLPLLFLVLPVLFHKETAEIVTSTRKRSGLRAFAEKFQWAAQNKTDLLLAIGPRAQAMRKLTSDSLGLGVLSNLIAIEQQSGRVIALSRTPATAGIPTSVRPLLAGADKLGSWCSQASMYETALLFQVTL